ncbi:hypothetical protein EJ08DRAFT_654648 [Tothia fuscella]|uniref:Uncharacterized protein n=1 Tax=Tothia fuscella TaxID=1048955 RepID=A0A9P4NEE5_9PEZI|nr:hypothetical protein EJ08DRAFT_654648 [Tothia fuscella]
MGSKATSLPSPTYIFRFAARPSTQCLYASQCQSRQFTVSLPRQRLTRNRRKFYQWLNGVGQNFKQPREGRTNYLSGYGADGAQRGGPSVGKEAEGTEEEQGDGEEAAAQVEGEGEGEGKEDAKADEALKPDEMERAEAETEEKERKASLREERVMERDKNKKPQSTRDLRPFPLNQHFLSQAVLSEEFREEIYMDIVESKKTVRSVSSDWGVSMERVGAVVRMKQMERDWLRQGKPLAVPYSRAVLSMLPITPLVDKAKEQREADKAAKNARDGNSGDKRASRESQPHEPINDLPVHPHTTQQLFYPVSESRAFTRADAGRAFHPKLRPTDERIPHPELIALEQLKKTTGNLAVFKQGVIDGDLASALAKANEQKDIEKQTVKTYAGHKWDFKFHDISVEKVGKTGRSRAGVGWRYGMPHEDRKPGQVKIPVRVES